MQEKRTDIVKYQGGLKTIPSHRQLMKVNRMLMGCVLFLMLLVVVLGYFFVPGSESIVNRPKAAVQTEFDDHVNNPLITAEVNNLKGQVVGLVSGSIESKLRNLEENIKLGSTAESLDTIADLKNDVKVLRSYSEGPKTETRVSNQELVQEVSHLKRLIYITLGSCALMFLASAGVWVKYRHLPYKEIKRFLSGKP